MYLPLASQPNDVFTHFKPTAPTMKTEAAIQHKSDQWSPYQNNSGTVLAIGLPGAVFIAGDTRLSQGYGIITRDASKLAKLTDKCYLATSGMYADFTALKKYLQTRLQIYQFQNDQAASTETVANLLSRTLYGRRTFPYYTFNCLAGLDVEGNGVVYSYDAVGSYDKMQYGVQGSAQELIVPVLDNQFVAYNKNQKKVPTTREEVIDLILDCFNAATERDIYTGDSVEIVMLTKEGEQRSVHQLRKD